MVKPISIQKLNQNPFGQVPKKDSFVTFKIFKNMQTTGQIHTCQLSANQINPEIEQLILSIKSGQKISFLYKNSQDAPQSKIILELISVQEGTNKKSPTQIAQNLKIQGNQLIKDKKYSQAAKNYEQGLQLLQCNFTQESVKIKVSLISNLSLAYLNSNQNEKCIQMCQQYMQLTLQPNKKIVYRKAQASKHQKKWDDALKFINFGMEICQNDIEGTKQFQILSDQLKREKKEQSQKQKKVYTKMFG